VGPPKLRSRLVGVVPPEGTALETYVWCIRGPTGVFWVDDSGGQHADETEPRDGGVPGGDPPGQ
jgi:hypothetical protein